MNRRTFMTLTSAALALPMPALAVSAGPYSPGQVDALLADGKIVFIDFFTNWCTTCRAQDRAIKALRKFNPEFDEKMTFVKVDWDVYSNSKLAKRLAIPRRSTLVVLYGDKEIGRIVADTRKSKIKALMNLALAQA